MGRIDIEVLRDAELRIQTANHARAIRANLAAGHAQTVEMIDEDVSFAISEPGVLAGIVRATAAVGALGAGQMVAALVEKAIELRAEVAGLLEIERMERTGDTGRVDRALFDRAMAKLPSLTTH